MEPTQDRAVDAFFLRVAREFYPECRTGDLLPDVYARLLQALEDAAQPGTRTGATDLAADAPHARLVAALTAAVAHWADLNAPDDRPRSLSPGRVEALRNLVSETADAWIARAR